VKFLRLDGLRGCGHVASAIVLQAVLGNDRYAPPAQPRARRRCPIVPGITIHAPGVALRVIPYAALGLPTSGSTHRREPGYSAGERVRGVLELLLIAAVITCCFTATDLILLPVIALAVFALVALAIWDDRARAAGFCRCPAEGRGRGLRSHRGNDYPSRPSAED
jgi:hypothetical protein